MEAYKWLHAYRDRVAGDLSSAWEDAVEDWPIGYRSTAGYETWSRKFGDGSVAEVLPGAGGYPIVRVVHPAAVSGYDWTVDTATGAATSPHDVGTTFGIGRDLPRPDPARSHGGLASVGHTVATDPLAEQEVPDRPVITLPRNRPEMMPDEPDSNRTSLVSPVPTAPNADPFGVDRDLQEWNPDEPRLPDTDEEGLARSLRGSAAWRQAMDVDGASRNTVLPVDGGLERLGARESLWVMSDGSSIHYEHDPITEANPQPRVNKFTVSVPHIAVRPGTVSRGETKNQNDVIPHTFTREHVFKEDGTLIGMHHSISANDPSGKTHTQTGSHIIGTVGNVEEASPREVARRARREIDATYRRGYGEASEAVNARRRAQQREEATATIIERGSPLMVSTQIARFGGGAPHQGPGALEADVLAGAREHGASQGDIQTPIQQMAGWIQAYAHLHPGVNGRELSPTQADLDNPGYVEKHWRKIRGVMHDSWQRRQRGEVLDARGEEQAEAWDKVLSAPMDAPLNRESALTSLPRRAWSASLMNGLTAKVRGTKKSAPVTTTPAKSGRKALPSEVGGPFEVLQAHVTTRHGMPYREGEPQEHFDHTQETEHFHGATSIEELEERAESLRQSNPEGVAERTGRKPRRIVVKIREGGEEKYVTMNRQSGKTMVSTKPPEKARHHGGQKLRFVAYNAGADRWRNIEGTPPWSTQLVIGMQARADKEGRAPTLEDLAPSHPARDINMPFESGIVSENNVPKMFSSISEAAKHLREAHPGQDHVLIPVHGETSDLAARGDPIEREDPVVSTRAQVTVVRGDGGESKMPWYGAAHSAAVAALGRHAAAKDIHDLVHSPTLGSQLRGWVAVNNDATSSEGSRPGTNLEAHQQMLRVRRGAVVVQPGGKTGIRVTQPGKPRTFTPRAR